jgi:Mn-dependent DtxR family transcriptional regulator
MQPEGDFDQVRRNVFDMARRLLTDRRPEQPPVTTSDIASELGLEMPLVVQALQSLAAEEYLDIKAGDEWQIAEIQGVRREL